MTTAQLLSRLRDLEVRLWAEGDRLCFNAPQGAITPEIREALGRHKPEILVLLRGGRSLAESAGPEPGPAPESAPAPLSFAQRRLWFLTQLEPESAAYNITRAARLEGDVRVEVLERCLAEVVGRHAILRTSFTSRDGEPSQIALPPVGLTLPVVDLQQLPADVRRGEADRLAAEEAQRPFDLTRPPLLRVFVLRLAAAEHVLPTSLHHIAGDAWSTAILFRELGALYESFSRGLPSPLPELPLQYTDYARWQRDRLAGALLEEQLAYWTEQLADAPPSLELPTDRPRSAASSSRGTAHLSLVPPATVARLQAFTRSERGEEGGTTPFMVLAAVFATLLFRWSGQDDLVVGLPVANRGHTSLEGLIGLFLDTVALRVRLGGDPTFAELLGRTRQATLGAYGHQDLPFERLVEALRPERQLHQTPIFQVVLSLQNVPRSDLAASSFRLGLLPPTNPSAQFDLVCDMEEAADGLRLSWRYRVDLFDASTITRLGEQFELLLEAALDDPGRPVAELPLLDTARRHQTLVEWNGPGMPLAPAAEPVCLHERFAGQAAARPDAVAVTFEDLSLTYGELAARARHLARRLRALGVGPDVRVGVRLERSAEMVVSLLGVLEAGGAYVPLDPGYPEERLDFMARDAELRVVIEETGLRVCEFFAAPAPTLPTVILSRALRGEGPGGGKPQDGNNLASAQVLRVAEAPLRMTVGRLDAQPAETNALAYVIYTSGSTGRPKGVGVSHAAADRLFTATAPWFGFGPGDVWTLFHSFSFDFSVWEMWGALLHGGRVVVVPEPARRSPEELLALLVREGVTVLDQTPSSFQQLVVVEGVEGEGAALPLALRWVIFGGEALDFHGLAPWMARHGDCRPRLVNMYGITETTVHVTYRVVTAEDVVRASLLGIPIPDLQVFLMDVRGMEPVPVGVPGEIWVGGAGLARGYLGRPDLTADRFRPHPWSEMPGARVYRSGDLARRRPDGDLEYLGRIDHQVKIRGYRVELGEVEAALAAFPGVRQAAAAVSESAPGDRRLVGYVVGEPGVPLDLGALRAFLEARLPGPFVPSALVPIAALPSTPGGKLDRAALARTGPLPEPAAATSSPTAAGPVAEALAGIWAEVLGVTAVGPGDDFFRLGGHSLLATAVLSRVRRAFRVDLPVAALFEASTLSGFAARIEGELRGGEISESPPLVPRPRYGGVPLSFAQRRLWFLDRLAPGNPFYNVPVVLRLRGGLRPAALEAALAEIVRRHEVLRSTLPELDGEPVQAAVPVLEVRLPLVDLSGLPAAARDGEAERLAEAEGRRPFDLAAGPLFRFSLLRTEAGDHRLLLTLHHVVTDAGSMGVLRRELETFYEGGGALPDLSIQYADFALWQRDWIAGGGMEGQLAWWKERLAGAPEEPGLPFDRPRPAKERFRGGAIPLRLPSATAAAVRAVARREGMTSFMVLLGAFQALLARLTGEEDVVVGTPIANRARPETEGLIGFFANTLVLRTDLSADPDGVELLDRARQTALVAYAHQDLPFEVLVEALAPERHLARNPLFQVLLVYQRLAGKGGLSDLAGLVVDGAPPQGAAGTGSAKFDLTLALVEGTEGETGFEGAVEYDADLFDPPTAARLAGQFTTLLAALAGEAPARLGDLPLLADAERHQLALEWNDVRDEAARLAAGLPVHAGFEAQAERQPGAPAVVWNGSTLTYGGLERTSAALAIRLRELGIGPGSRVGLCVERSFAMPVGVLGILRAGAAYVPLDPEYPRERLAFMLDDLRQGQEPVLVTQEWLIERLAEEGEAVLPVFLGDSGEMDDLMDDPMGDLPAPASVQADPDDLAYVIYTSGSTGRPKGVALPHRPLSNLLAWHLGALAGGIPILGFASLSFDVSFYEMFLAWSSGGTLVLAGEDERRDPVALDALLRSARVEKAILPVVVLQQLAAEWERLGGPPPDLREITTTGERLQITPAVAEVFRSGGPFRLHNHYGPAETHVATAWTLDPDPAAWDDFPPIGRPIANVTIHLLDAWGRPAAPGASGDLHIGGVCLARGYFGRPDLTAERFVPDPFMREHGGGRLYRTGDRARLRPDGAIEYQGRFDHQVKIRGFRVEPGEIEAALARHPAVAEAVVIPRDGKLVAYVVPRGDAAPDPGNLADALRVVLPSFMVPAAFVSLPALPLNRNGKVDRRALPAPGAASTLEAAEEGRAGRRVAPRTPAEEVVVAAWGEALGVDPAAISVHDDFFRLGGHSLLATRVVSRLRASFGVEVAVRLVFEASTVEALARRVEELAREGRGVASPPIRSIPRPGVAGPAPEAPLSFAQEWMWLADRLDPGGSAYLSPMPVRLRGRLDVPALARSVHEVVRRHEMLRTTFPVAGSGPVQRIAPALDLALPWVDLEEIPEEARDGEAARLLTAELRVPLDLERGPLLRLLLLRLGPEEHHLLLTAHHILFDGWSNGLLLAEVAALYGAFSRGEPSPLQELPIQYADFASWQRGWLQGETLERLLGYWRRELAGELPVLRLPGSRPEGVVTTMRSARQTVELGMELSAGVQALARSRGTTVFTVLLAALQALLHRLTGQDDILVGTPVAGRTRPEVEKLIGYFINTLVMRGRLGGDPSFQDLLAQVWETALGAWAHQDLPFTRLVAELRPDRAASRTPLFQVLFLLQNAPMPAAALPGLEMEGVNAEVPIATFDLALSLKETPFGIAGWFFYNRDLFEPDAVELLAEGYRQLLEGAVAAPERRLSELPVTEIVAAAEPAPLPAGHIGPIGPAGEEGTPAEPAAAGPITDLSPEQRALLMLRLRRKAREDKEEEGEMAVAAPGRDNLGS